MEVSGQLHSWIIYPQVHDQFTYGYEAGSAQEQICATSRQKLLFPNNPASSLVIICTEFYATCCVKKE
jgi:hypothetical protein